MPQISGRIMYINDAKPGQRSGSIKLDTGDYVNIPTNLLYQYQRGMEVTLDYTDRQSRTNGKWYKDLVVGQAAPPAPSYAPPRPPQPQVSRPAARPPAPPAAARSGPSGGGAFGGRSAQDYNTGKQIAVTGITQRAVQAGAALTSIPAIMKSVAQTYDEIFNPQPVVQQQPQYQPAGPRDEIPFNDGVEDIGYDEEDPNRPPF